MMTALLALCLYAAAEAPAPPAITAREAYEDFESYRGVLTRSPWPHEGGWMTSPYGFPIDAGLDHVVKHAGDFALRLRYRIGDSQSVAFSRLYSPPLRWGRYDAVRFWLRPDGSGRRLTFFVLEQERGDGKKWFWESGFVMTGSEPVIVTIPFQTFVQDPYSFDPAKRFDWSEIEETAFWVRAGDERGRPSHNGTGPRNPEIPSTIWIDDVEVVKLARPLDRVVATPAPRPARVPDPVVRVDYGAEADWTDAEGHLWRADVPAKEGILFSAPEAPVPGAAHPMLYRTLRRGVKKLRVPVANGRYRVVLHFAELDPRVTATGERAFQVLVEGASIGVVDPFTLGGGFGHPATRATTVDVTDGTVDVTFEPRANEPTIAAIEILPP